jgi:hypothetical protein
MDALRSDAIPSLTSSEKDVYYYNEILHLSIKIINDGQLGYNEYNFNI